MEGDEPANLGFQGPAGYQGQQGPYTGQQAYANGVGFPPGAQVSMYAGNNSLEDGVVYVNNEEEKEGLYKLLKSDYNQEFVDFGEVPQNFVREVDANVRFANYPRWDRLINAAEAVHRARVHPPQFIRGDLRHMDLTTMFRRGVDGNGPPAVQFDVFLIDPPWREYVDRTPGMKPTEDNCWSLDELKALPIPEIASSQSFLFLWAGDTHLDDARELMTHWGYRRCEDITWLKTVPHMNNRPGAGIDSVLNGKIQGSQVNGDLDMLDKLRRVVDWATKEKLDQEASQNQLPSLILGNDMSDPECILRRVKEHCLVGLRGVIRRSLDHHIVHANIDTDVIIGDVPVGYDPPASPELGGLCNTRKPAELYDIIERFALGRRKIELFASNRNIRPGWLSIGRDVVENNFDLPTYASWFQTVVHDPPTGAAMAGAGGDDQSEVEQYLKANALHPTNVNPLTRAMGMDHLSKDDCPLTDYNAYPYLKNFVGGIYEGSSPLLESLRPKSPPQRPTKTSWGDG